MGFPTTRISTALLTSAIPLALAAICSTAALRADGQRAAAAAPSSTQAQPPATADTSIVTPVDPDTFISDMAQAGMVDAELGTLAVKNASNVNVKALGRTMVADAREMREELTLYASRLHLHLPTQLDQSQRSVVDRLSGLHDAAFDREFLNVIVQRQLERTSTLRTVATGPSRALELTHKSNDRVTGLAEWSAHTLPRAQHHLTRAQQLLSRPG